MTAFKPVAHHGDFTDNSDGVVTTNGLTVQTGVYRILNADAVAMHFSWGGAPNAGSDALHVNVASDNDVFVKLAAPKRVKITGATAANPCVLTVGQGGTPAHPFSVGDYITITGSSVSAYNVTHVEVTAVTNTTITVSSDQSSSAAFTGDATVSNSIKISFQGDSSNGLTVHLDEVQLLG
jgi:hypothetical protein